MECVNLFSVSDAGGQQWVTSCDLLQALREVSAQECDLLFIHTDLSSFGAPNPGLKRREYLGAIFDTMMELGVKTTVFPAFTFSFANHEKFDVRESSAKYMGALNEFARKQPGAHRSLDPMMSVIAFGEKAPVFEHVGKRCMEEGGVFSLLHTTPRVKFLFLGANPALCFTYAHYVEAVYQVPYRFEKWFTGTIVDKDGKEYTDSYSVYAGCKGITPAAMIPFEREMLKRNAYQTKTLGAGNIICFKEEDAYNAVWAALEENIHGFLTKPFAPEDLVHELKASDGNRVVAVP